MYWPPSISSHRPLLVLGWDVVDAVDRERDAECLVAAYQALPLKPWTEVAMVMGDLPPSELEIYCRACDRASVPLVLQVRTWPGEWLPVWKRWSVSVAASQRRRCSSGGVELLRIFDRRTALRGPSDGCLCGVG